MSYEEQEWMDYCDRLTHKHAAHYLHFLAAYPMALSIRNPEFEDDF